MDIKATWHLHDLSDLQGTLNGNVLHLTINPSQWNLNVERISQNTYIYEDLPHKGNISLSKKRKSVLHYYKNPKPLENKVRITYTSSSTLELRRKFSNLTFAGSLAGTTPVPSWGLLFCVVQVFSWAREDRVTYWRFLASSVCILHTFAGATPSTNEGGHKTTLIFFFF